MMNSNYAYMMLIMRALAIAIVFGQSNAYRSHHRSIDVTVGDSSQLPDNGNVWKRSLDRHYFEGNTVGDDDDNEEDAEENIDATVSSLPLKRFGSGKRSLASRLCGNKLVEAIVKMCNGCVKPAGGKPVSAKRSILNVVKRSSLTEKCCVHRCTFEDMKSFCCE